MSRSVTSLFRQAAYAQQTEEVEIMLVTISHAQMPSPLRLTSDGTETTSRGDIFISIPFEVVLPSEEDSRIPEAQLRIDNVSRYAIDEVRTLASPPSVTMEIVMSGDPDTVVASFPDFTLRDVTYDVVQITGRLSLENLLSEPYPPTIQSAATHPGLF